MARPGAAPRDAVNQQPVAGAGTGGTCTTAFRRLASAPSACDATAAAARNMQPVLPSPIQSAHSQSVFRSAIGLQVGITSEQQSVACTGTCGTCHSLASAALHMAAVTRWRTACCRHCRPAHVVTCPWLTSAYHITVSESRCFVQTDASCTHPIIVYFKGTICHQSECVLTLSFDVLAHR